MPVRTEPRWSKPWSVQVSGAARRHGECSSRKSHSKCCERSRSPGPATSAITAKPSCSRCNTQAWSSSLKRGVGVVSSLASCSSWESGTFTSFRFAAMRSARAITSGWGGPVTPPAISISGSRGSKRCLQRDNAAAARGKKAADATTQAKHTPILSVPRNNDAASSLRSSEAAATTVDAETMPSTALWPHVLKIKPTRHRSRMSASMAL
mmetsp:Transcript_21973/g.65529  ORF Transcript_21973/g.65529 Transcript_21973/m.65529 type:complete len:209 (-) Transcript_21973:66-692(-)